MRFESFLVVAPQKVRAETVGRTRISQKAEEEGVERAPLVGESSVPHRRTALFRQHPVQ